MSKLRKFVARLYDLPNAYRVLDIMDEAHGVDIIPAQNIVGQKFEGCYDIKLKNFLSEENAKDLQKITLFQSQYKQRNKVVEQLFHLYFKRYRVGCRILKTWI